MDAFSDASVPNGRDRAENYNEQHGGKWSVDLLRMSATKPPGAQKVMGVSRSVRMPL